MGKSRLGWGALLAILTSVAAGMAGLIVGRTQVPPSSGFAGPAILLSWAFGFWLGGLVLGILAACFSRAEALPRLNLGAGLLTLLVGAALVLSISLR